MGSLWECFRLKEAKNLQSEKNNYFSLGAEYSKERFFINVNAYANIFNKKIEGVWRIYDMQYNFEYINLKSQRMLGIEAIMKWRMTDNFMLNATYSYVNVSKTEWYSGQYNISSRCNRQS